VLQVSHPIAAELLAEQVGHGQALLQRARIIGEPDDYNSWKVAREEWVALTTQALGRTYEGSDEADEFKSAASFSPGEGKWQVEFERDMDCVRAAIGVLVSLQDRVEAEHQPTEGSEQEQAPLVGSELTPAPPGGAELEQRLADGSGSSRPATTSEGPGQGGMSRVFLVHGRNDRWKQAVVNVL
jgi:hypothetical protein